ncbi:Gfo/Idh/MocA family protein [Prauserella cavernicola]|uniref:Gfo/Idh/MocA family oxidoreductase n=1 Tax=Prauserella cavernicola TaxID=2800127 RepID=A0A934V579_9PSEU|nr:Gfo/Idh/MocA family oxidoreductase [Prauserella cavernicola]MBK1789176.1 Gfo/Idh/MocA family oxidoreductase [Prauserella cavernicola]
MHRIGLVGTGRIAHWHVAGIREVLGADPGHPGEAATPARPARAARAVITAVCDPDEGVRTAFAERHGIASRFATVADLVASGEVDVVIDVTPPSARPDVVPVVLEAGLPILVEKPFGNSAIEALGYTELARRQGVPLAVNQNFRWFPEIEATKAALADPDFGSLRYLHHSNFQDRVLPEGDWRARDERLELAIFGVHILDRVLWLADRPPVAVSAVLRRSPSLGYQGELFTAIQLFFADDLVASMTSSWLSAGLPEARLRVDGEHASIEATRWHAARGDARWSLGYRGADPVSRYYRDTGHFAPAFGTSLARLLDAIETGTEPVHSGRNNLRTIGALDAAYLSASRGGAITTLEEVGLDPAALLPGVPVG